MTFLCRMSLGVVGLYGCLSVLGGSVVYSVGGGLTLLCAAAAASVAIAGSAAVLNAVVECPVRVSGWWSCVSTVWGIFRAAASFLDAAPTN